MRLRHLALALMVIAALCWSVVSIAQNHKADAAQNDAAADDAPADDAPAEPGPTLKVGDAAPKLYAGKWLNGDAVEKFEPGKVYVIEFWASWCGPCLAAMPHLSEMNTKMKDQGVVVIGMNVAERNPKDGEAFATGPGKELMNYPTALDQFGRSSQAWMEAAQQPGLPTTFVVDKKGRVAWIGHPMGGLGRVVKLLVEDKFDARAEAQRVAKVEAIQEKMSQAFDGEQWDTLLKLMDEMVALEPEFAAQAAQTRFAVLLAAKKDADKAYESVKKDYDALKDSVEALHGVAWVILEAPDVPKRDLDIALQCITRAQELTEGKDPQVLHLLASLHHHKGDLDKAIAAQQEAIDAADHPGLRRQLAQRLETYQAEKANKKE